MSFLAREREQAPEALSRSRLGRQRRLLLGRPPLRLRLGCLLLLLLLLAHNAVDRVALGAAVRCRVVRVLVEIDVLDILEVFVEQLELATEVDHRLLPRPVLHHESLEQAERLVVAAAACRWQMLLLVLVESIDHDCDAFGALAATLARLAGHRRRHLHVRCGRRGSQRLWYDGHWLHVQARCRLASSSDVAARLLLVDVEYAVRVDGEGLLLAAVLVDDGLLAVDGDPMLLLGCGLIVRLIMMMIVMSVVVRFVESRVLSGRGQRGRGDGDRLVGADLEAERAVLGAEVVALGGGGVQVGVGALVALMMMMMLEAARVCSHLGPRGGGRLLRGRARLAVRVRRIGRAAACVARWAAAAAAEASRQTAVATETRAVLGLARLAGRARLVQIVELHLFLANCRVVERAGKDLLADRLECGHVGLAEVPAKHTKHRERMNMC